MIPELQCHLLSIQLCIQSRWVQRIIPWSSSKIHHDVGCRADTPTGCPWHSDLFLVSPRKSASRTGSNEITFCSSNGIVDRHVPPLLSSVQRYSIFDPILCLARSSTNLGTGQFIDQLFVFRMKSRDIPTVTNWSYALILSKTEER